MKKLLFLILLNIFFFNLDALKAQRPLSSSAEISLLTCSPGTEIYSLFGHKDIRVKDPVRGIDIVFNYGLFDYSTPNFTLKFIRGKLLYRVGIEQFPRFEYMYSTENRQVTEEVFNFNQDEKQRVFEFLINNTRPENAEYHYDFFFDNCASRLRDVLKNVLKDDIKFSPPKDKKFISYRRQLDYYLDGKYAKSPWTDFGMDLILGIPADQEADFEGEMFLPDHLSKNLSEGTLRDSVPLLQKGSIIIPQKTPPSIATWTITPTLFFWILCGLTGLFFLTKNNTFTKIFDFVLFLILGLAGILFLFMWLATDHEVCYQNLNLLWMNPIHILLAINILRNNINNFWKKYLWVTLIVNILLILLWKVLPQDFHVATLPIILLVSMRIVAYLKNEPAA